MHRMHQKNITDAEPYAVSLQDVVLKIKKNHQITNYKCLKCGALLNSRLKLSHHICVDSQGCITCKVLCPDGTGLSNWQTVMFLKKKREYLCHSCGTSFTDNTSFQMHVHSHGVGVELKKFICEHCSYATNNKFYFKVHMRGQHCNEPRPRPHVCELCGKTFVFKGVLEQHKQYMHVKDKIFQCTVCPKFFYRRQSLARHLRTHSGQRPWVCSDCGQGFTVKYNLKVHERLHSGEKPYKCEHCGAAFAQKNSLNVHMKKHESGREHLNSHSHHSRKLVNTNPHSKCTETVNPHVRESPDPPHLKEKISPSPSKDVCHSHAKDSANPAEDLSLNPRSMHSGYATYPDYAMTVFPSVPGLSYQFMPVTRP